MVLLALAVLLALVGTAIAYLRHPRPASLASLVLTSIGWLLLNQPVEGPILAAVTASHGLTLADLAIPVIWLAVLGRLLWMEATQPQTARHSRLSVRRPSMVYRVMTTSPQEPPGPGTDPDIDPMGAPPVTDPDTMRPDVQPSPAGGDPLTADPGSPTAPPV